MSIRIKKLNVKNLGPIDKLKWEPDELNLVFGDNEKGKSYLVEFLIHSLFKARKWSDLRDKSGSGKVLVSGLSDQTIEFSPAKKNKLKNELTRKKEYLGLPPDFSKLLVVRPADIELGGDKESDKLMMRRFLSHKEILEKIENNIKQESVKKCQISGFKIQGENRGKISDREDLKTKLKKINSLFEEIEEKYFDGELYQLKEKQKKLGKEKKKIKRAKRHQAYQLNQEKKEIEEKINKIKERVIDKLISQASALKRDEAKIEQQEKELSSLKKKTKEFQWLSQAVEIYRELNFESILHRPRLPLLLGLSGGFLLTGTLILLGLKLAAIIVLMISAASVIFLIMMQDKYLKEFGKRDELNKLKNEFEKKFNRRLSDLADLKAEKEKIKKDYNKKIILEEEITKNERSLSSEKANLLDKVRSLLKKDIAFSQCREALAEQKVRKGKLQKELSNKNQQLAVLDVEKEEFLTQAQEIKYDRAKEEKLKQALNKLNEQIQEKEAALENLKHKILAEINQENGREIKDLIEPLAEKREQTLSEYKQLTAEIIAKKNVYEVIKKLYKAEDEKIEKVLNSKLMKELLPKLTTRYEEIDLENDHLIVSDPYNSFRVSQISDGAKEQVFLALRIALAAEWFKEEKMFLILDDAFIHSDKHRKVELIEKVIDLSKSGWQIICFSFDERIKNLFDKNTEEYNLLNLNKI